jgi:hypothetical protein
MASFEAAGAYNAPRGRALEAIHPFTDGNGRTGRILNLLFLIEHELLELPVLYLSRAIIRTKADYYRWLHGRDDPRRLCRRPPSMCGRGCGLLGPEHPQLDGRRMSAG